MFVLEDFYNNLQKKKKTTIKGITKRTPFTGTIQFNSIQQLFIECLLREQNMKCSKALITSFAKHIMNCIIQGVVQ